MTHVNPFLSNEEDRSLQEQLEKLSVEANALMKGLSARQLTETISLTRALANRQSLGIGLQPHLLSRPGGIPAMGFAAFDALSETQKLRDQYLSTIAERHKNVIGKSLNRFRYPPLGLERFSHPSPAVAEAARRAAVVPTALQFLSSASFSKEFRSFERLHNLLADAKTQREMMLNEINRVHTNRSALFASIRSTESSSVDEKPVTQYQEVIAQIEFSHDQSAERAVHYHQHHHYHFGGSVGVVQIGNKNNGVVERQFQQSSDIVCDILYLLHDARDLLCELSDKFRDEAEERIEKAMNEAIRLPFNPDSVKKSINLLNQIFHTTRATQSFCYRLLSIYDRF